MTAKYCSRGHELTPENSYTRREGYVECRTCIRARGTRREDRQSCGRGHPWSPETTQTASNGNRICLVCRELTGQGIKRESPVPKRQQREHTQVVSLPSQPVSMKAWRTDLPDYVREREFLDRIGWLVSRYYWQKGTMPTKVLVPAGVHIPRAAHEIETLSIANGSDESYWLR